jgi:hypothetical protein
MLTRIRNTLRGVDADADIGRNGRSDGSSESTLAVPQSVPRDVSLEVDDGVHGKHKHVALRSAIERRTAVGMPIGDFWPHDELGREPVLPTERKRQIVGGNPGPSPPTVGVTVELRTK